MRLHLSGAYYVKTARISKPVKIVITEEAQAPAKYLTKAKFSMASKSHYGGLFNCPPLTVTTPQACSVSLHSSYY